MLRSQLQNLIMGVVSIAAGFAVMAILKLYGGKFLVFAAFRIVAPATNYSSGPVEIIVLNTGEALTNRPVTIMTRLQEHLHSSPINRNGTLLFFTFNL